jgi:predicted dehydrogenase
MTGPTRCAAIVVGAGLMGRWHADAVERCGGRVVAFVDSDPARARALAGHHASCSVHPDLAAALSRESASVVHVCTPTSTHDLLAREAIEAGCHVLVEKPLAPTVDVTKRLLDLAAERGVLMSPVHQFVVQPGVIRTGDLLPELGTVRHIDFVVCSAGAANQSDWKRDEIAVDILPHPFSVLERLLPARFPAFTWHLAHVAPGELRLWAAAEGLTAGILVSMSGRPTMNVIRLIADGGTVHADLFHGFAVREAAAVSRARKILRPFALSTSTLSVAATTLARRLVQGEAAYPGLRELVRRFYAAIANGGRNPIPPPETLAVAGAYEQVLRAIKRSD